MRRRPILPLLVVTGVLVTGAATPGPAGAVQAPDVIVRRDIVYAAPDGSALFLDAYLPPAPGTYPGVVVIPAGRWVYGTRTDNFELAADLTALGFVAFSVNYRSALKGFPYPAAVEDVTAAVRYIRDHAAEFRLDPARLGAMGASAGGHLAGMLGALGQGRLDTGARVAAVVSWSGPMDLPLTLATAEEDVRSGVLTFLGCPPGQDCTDLAREASPVTHVDPTDAPMFLSNSTQEKIPLGQVVAMAAALEANGVPYDLVQVDGAAHGQEYALTEEFRPRWIGFLTERLSAVPAPPGAGTVTGGGSVNPTAAPLPTVVPAGDGAADPGGGPSLPLVLAVAASVLASVLASVSLGMALRVRRSAAGHPSGPIGPPAAATPPE